MKIELERFTGKLPDAKHQFSTLIFNEDEGKYYELNPTYHRKHPSTKAYKKWWQFRYQKTSEASDALIAHALSVVRRSKVQPVECKYMTTAILHHNHLRHVCAVKLTSGDFAKLRGQGFLRPLHQGDEAMSQGERIRQMIYGLLPFTLRNASMAA
jgi:hypothetical protein